MTSLTVMSVQPVDAPEIASAKHARETAASKAKEVGRRIVGDPEVRTRAEGRMSIGGEDVDLTDRLVAREYTFETTEV